jgi:hypothetical protein
MRAIICLCGTYRYILKRESHSMTSTASTRRDRGIRRER